MPQVRATSSQYVYIHDVQPFAATSQDYADPTTLPVSVAFIPADQTTQPVDLDYHPAEWDGLTAAGVPGRWTVKILVGPDGVLPTSAANGLYQQWVRVQGTVEDVRVQAVNNLLIR